MAGTGLTDSSSRLPVATFIFVFSVLAPIRWFGSAAHISRTRRLPVVRGRGLRGDDGALPGLQARDLTKRIGSTGSTGVGRFRFAPWVGSSKTQGDKGAPPPPPTCTASHSSGELMSSLGAVVRKSQGGLLDLAPSSPPFPKKVGVFERGSLKERMCTEQSPNNHLMNDKGEQFVSALRIPFLIYFPSN